MRPVVKIGIAVVAVGLMGAAGTMTMGLPIAITNAALQKLPAAPSVAVFPVLRLSFASLGDSVPSWWYQQSGTCNSHGANSDGVNCSDGSDGNSFAAGKLNFTVGTGGVVTADGYGISMSSSPNVPSASQIYQWATGPSAGLTTWDNIRSVIQVNSGTTVNGMNGYGSYVDNEVASLSGSSRNGVNYFGTCLAGVNNAWCWGNNIVLSDSKTQTAGSLTGVNLIGVEINPNVWSTNTVVNGVQLVGDSGVQPQVANGFVCNLLDISGAARAKWSGCLVSAAGAANTAAIIGQQSASGNNINSQTISFGVFDNTGAAKSYQFQGTSGASISSYNFTHTIGGTVFWSFDAPILTSANTGYYVNFDNLIGADGAHNAVVAGGAGIATVEVGNTTAPVTIAAPSLIFAAPSAGTPVASICIDATNHIFKKTTAGSCI